MRQSLQYFAVLLLMSSAASASTAKIQVNGLVCGFCAQGLEKSFSQMPATKDIYVSLENKLVAVEFKDGQDISDAALEKTITEAGFAVVSIDRSFKDLPAVKDSVPALKK